MIYDAFGQIWVEPIRIGFHRNVMHGSNEPADSVTFSHPQPQAPEWVADKAHAQPYATQVVRVRQRVP